MLIKIAIIGGVLAIVMLVLMLVLRGDDQKPLLDQLGARNAALAALSIEAQNELDEFATKAAATELASTSTSDNQALSDYYQQAYNKALPANDAFRDSVLAKLEDARPGNDYAQTYRQEAKELIRSNSDLIRQLLPQAKAGLKPILEQIDNNQQTIAERL